MADHQRVHPLQDSDAAAQSNKTTTPLVARGSFRSDGGDPESQYPPPLRRAIPYSPSKPPRRRCSCFKKCLCWTISLLLILLIILGILAAIIFLVFQPKLPKYSADSMRITKFNLTGNSLSASLNLNITARNPNKKIGIYYVGGSHLSVWYTGTKLCEGSLPEFYQGHRNTTVLNLTLAGQTDDATGLLQSLRAAQQSGSVPLNLRAKVPVRLKLGRLKLMKLKFLVKCRGEVDTFGEGEVIRIRNSSCKFRFRV